MSLPEDKQLIAEFVTESREGLADVENQLLSIEAAGVNVDLDLVNGVFRTIHSIKGAAGFFGLTALSQLSHNLESVLNLVRNRQLVPDAGMTSVMLRSADRLRQMLDDIDRSNEMDISEYVDLLQQIVGGLLADDTRPAAAPSAGAVPAQAAAPECTLPPNAAGEPAADPGAANPAPPSETEGAADAGPSPAQASPAAAAGPATASAPAETNIRVSVTVLDRLMNLAGELVLARNQLLQTVQAAQGRVLDAVAARVNQVTSELQETIMQTRLQMVGTVFNKFPRVVRDLSKLLGKQCQLTLEGQEVELDKSVIEAIGDPLTHLVRNAVDHGIESPAARLRAGKPAVGRIVLRAFHQAGKVVISIRDDGAGINLPKVREKALARGLIGAEQARSMGDREVLQLLFRPGFSTVDQVTEVSGRGVGMDVVKTNIERLGGTVAVESEPGRGALFTVKLPLTLAIVPALIVGAAGRRYAIPQANIGELVRIRASESAGRIQRVKNAELLRLRGELLPLAHLGEVLGAPGPATTGQAGHAVRNIVVVEAGHLRYGLIVDRLYDSEEIVVKPLGRHLKDCACLAGATILGDGAVALILDVAVIAARCRFELPEQDAAADAQLAAADAQETPPVLVFRNHPDEQFAIPMQLIARLERIRCDQIETVGEQKVLQFRGATLPLLSLEDFIRARPRPAAERAHVVVFTFAGREVGLIIDQVMDIREFSADADARLFRQPGVIGSTVIDGKATRMLDLFELASAAYPQWATRVAPAPAAEGRPRTILVAEDSTFFRKQLTAVLEQAGYQVLACEDGALAWEALRQPDQQIDLVVTDIEMPNLNGFELARRIKDDPVLAALPVLAVTSLSSEEDQRRGAQAGIDEYHIKLDREQLIAAVDRRLAPAGRGASSAGRAPVAC